MQLFPTEISFEDVLNSKLDHILSYLGAPDISRSCRSSEKVHTTDTIVAYGIINLTQPIDLTINLSFLSNIFLCTALLLNNPHSSSKQFF